jgi:hypothetical protein
MPHKPQPAPHNFASAADANQFLKRLHDSGQALALRSPGGDVFDTTCERVGDEYRLVGVHDDEGVFSYIDVAPYTLHSIAYPHRLKVATDGPELEVWELLVLVVPDAFDFARTEVDALAPIETNVVVLSKGGIAEVTHGRVHVVDYCHLGDEDDIYEVIVGNIGTVYRGKLRETALQIWDDYATLSQGGYGRAGGEPVTLVVNYPNGLHDTLAELAGSDD